MTDFQPDFALGENVLKTTDDQSTTLVELFEDVIKGEALFVTGENSEGAEIVSIINAVTDDVKYIAMETGLAGEMARVLHKGRTKLTYGAAFTVGTRLEFTVASKVITTTATHFSKAVAVDASVADGDLGFVDFDGGLTPLGVASS